MLLQERIEAYLLHSIYSFTEKTVVVKGKAPVDAECPIASTYHVYYDDDIIWDCMLNQVR